MLSYPFLISFYIVYGMESLLLFIPDFCPIRSDVKQFRPLMPDLEHHEAEKAAEYMKERLQADAKTIQRDEELRPTIDF